MEKYLESLNIGSRIKLCLTGTTDLGNRLNGKLVLHLG
jgi:hypothetical protein